MGMFWGFKHILGATGWKGNKFYITLKFHTILRYFKYNVKQKLDNFTCCSCSNMIILIQQNTVKLGNNEEISKTNLLL